MLRPCLPPVVLLLAAIATAPAPAQTAPRDGAVTAPLPVAPAPVRAQSLASGAADEFTALDSARRGKLAREQLAGWLLD